MNWLSQGMNGLIVLLFLYIGSHLVNSSLLNCRSIVDPSLVHGIQPSLVQVDEEDNVIPEACQSVGGGHRNDKGKNIVDESVESFVHERAPGKCRHRLELVVDEQLGQHEQEAKGVNTIHQAVDSPGVPTRRKEKNS